MKKLYVLLFTIFSLSTFHFGHAQSNIDLAAIKITNSSTTNSTSTAVGVSATALVRGTGVDAASSGSNVGYFSDQFRSINLDAADTAKDYIEWTVSANSGHTININILKLAITRHNGQAANKFTVRYRTGNWTTEITDIKSFAEKTHGGTNINEEFELVPTTAINIISGTTVTFRLYAYGSNNNQPYGIGQLPINASTLTNERVGIVMRGTTANSTLVFNNGTWTPFAPSSTTVNNSAEIKSGTYTIGASQNINVKNLTLESNTKIIVPPTSSVTVAGNLNSFGTLELNSNSTKFSSLIVNGQSGGLANGVVYKRHVNSYDNKNDLISPILIGQFFTQFRTNNPNLKTGDTNKFLFGPFSKSTGIYVNYTTSDNFGLDTATGYRAASTDNGTFTFTGQVNTGVITKELRYSGPYSTRWNLIGNPYPSYINAKEFLDRNLNELSFSEAAIYGYDGNAADGWVILNFNTMSDTYNITPGQGFFVAVDNGGGTAYFETTMRRVDNTDDFIPNRPTTTNKAHLQLKISSDSNESKTDVYFNDQSTKSLDRGYDAAVFNQKAPSFAIYSQLIDGNTGLDMAIQSLPFTDLDTGTIIPIGINASKGQQITVNLNETLLPEGTEVYLEDKLTNSITLLSTSDYTFTAQTNITTTGRFFLTFKRTTLSVDTEEEVTNGLHIYATNKIVVVKGLLDDDTIARVYDIQGRIVYTAKLKAQTSSNEINLSQVNAGIYIIKLTNKSQDKTQKIILK